MSNTKNGNTSSSFPILGLLGVLFVGLKLTGFITWSWWWVTIPFWGGAAIVIVILLVGSLIVGLASVIGDAMDKRAKAKRDQATVQYAVQKNRPGPRTRAA